jgi:hypothetical protein
LAEKGVKCKITKYVERVWLKDGNNASEIMRAFIIDLPPENTKSLEKFSFIIPRLVKKCDLENLSRLSVDHKCFLNEEGRTTGDINIIDKNRVIFDDFDCRVDHNHTIKPHTSGKATRIDFDLRNNPIPPGERELFRIGFNINNLVDEVPNVLTFKFSYFAIEECKKDIFLELSHAYEIVPIVPIYNIETLQGGFDIFVYAPPDKEIGSPVSNYNHVSMNYDYKGNLLKKRLNGIRWHLREIINSPSEEIILGKNNDFSSRKRIEGTIRTPVQLKDIKNLKRSSIINLVVGGIGALAGIIALLLHFFSKTPSP